MDVFTPFETVETPKLVCTRCGQLCTEYKCKCGSYSVYAVRRARRTTKGR